jgi:hypothetical protein
MEIFLKKISSLDQELSKEKKVFSSKTKVELTKLGEKKNRLNKQDRKTGKNREGER